MSRILITDETSAAERFSGTDAGYANIGSGAGVDRISYSGTAFATLNAIIAALRVVPASVNPSNGSVAISGVGSTATVSGLTWKQILVIEIGGIGIHRHFAGPALGCQDSPSGPANTCTATTSSSFTVTNHESQDGTCPYSPSYTLHYAYV